MIELIIFVAVVLTTVLCFRTIRAFLTSADEIMLDNTIKWVESHDIDVEENDRKYNSIINHKSLRKPKSTKKA